MPPAFLNHRVPTAGGTPTLTAASSLAVPAAIAAQNRRRSSRPATGGRPGEDKGTRPERSERRFRMFIATPVKVLRRPFESAQYAAELYRGMLTINGLVGSMGRRGNPYDNAKAESFMKTLKVEAVYPMAFETFDDVAEHLPPFIEETHNKRRLHSALGYLSPKQYEDQHIRQTGKSAA
jgi:hypothetical protein